MTTALKKKLCWNCEGRVSLKEENCPYCAVYLGPAPDESSDQHILAPPYRLVDSEEDDVPPSPYMSDESQTQTQEEDKDYTQAKSDLNEVVMPMALLSAGALFFVFGIVLMLFSNHGVLTLSWNGECWYLYLILSLPLLCIGWWTLQREKEVENHEASDPQQTKPRQEEMKF